MLPRPRLGRAGEGQPQLSRRGGAVRALIGSHENTSLSQTPFALSLSKGRSFFSTSKRRAVLRQAQHERGQEAFLFSRKPGKGPPGVRVDARSGRPSSRGVVG